MFQYQDVVDRLRRSEGRRVIQEALKMSPRKIKEIRALARENGWLSADTPLPSELEIQIALKAKVGVRPQQVPRVEPYRELVERWHGQGMEAKTIWAALVRNHGYPGSYSSVQRFVKRLAASQPDPVVRLHFGPGDYAQVDFCSGPPLLDPNTGKQRKTHFFVMTLAHSRHQYAEIVWDQSVATWLRCHRNAFEFFGGVPAHVVCDNLKSAITRACRYDPEVQKSYGEFARGYGFIISPCIPETPEHKGRVESGVRYIKRSFSKSPRTLLTLANSNEQLLAWVLGEAGNRTHGTTQQIPLQVFAEVEKPALKPLPADKVEIAVWSTVKIHPDSHAIFEKSYYSAPHRYISKKLDLRAGESTVSMFSELDLVALHCRASRPGQWMTNLDHLPPEKTAYLHQTPRWCLQQAQSVGPNCLAFMEELLGDRVTDRIRGAQGALRLGKKFGRKRLENACGRALAYDNVRYRTLKRILEQGLDQLPSDESEGGQLELPLAADCPRFARPIIELFSPR